MIIHMHFDEFDLNIIIITSILCILVMLYYCFMMCFSKDKNRVYLKDIEMDFIVKSNDNHKIEKRKINGYFTEHENNNIFILMNNKKMYLDSKCMIKF